MGDISGDCAPLPSGRAMSDLVAGDPDAIGRVLFHTLLRASLVGTGMYLMGSRRETLIRDALAGSLGIDAFVLAWVLWKNGRPE